MTTSDEPMLPQPADDNSPMISGRGTKTIADARGAYLVGNLRALLDHMDEAQQSRFRTAVLKQPIAYAEWWAKDASPEIWARRLNAASLRWIKHPSEQNRAAVQELYDESPGDQSELEEQIKTACNAALFCLLVDHEDFAEWTLADKACMMMSIAEHNSGLAYDSPGYRIWNEYIKRTPKWQIEAAWAILQGKEPSPFEMQS